MWPPPRSGSGSAAAASAPRSRAIAPAAATSIIRRRAWLFDLDGTLVDSAPAHAAAFRDAVAELAPELLAGFSYADHAGSSTRGVVTALGARGPLIDKLIRRKQERYRGYVDAGQVPVFPGAHALLDRLARQGRAVYLVTSGSRGSVDRVLAASSLRHRLHATVTSDDLPVSKPDPAVYQAACQRWAVEPGDAVVVEDSDHGVRAALGAGLLTVQVHAPRPLAGAIPVPRLAELMSLIDLERV